MTQIPKIKRELIRKNCKPIIGHLKLPHNTIAKISITISPQVANMFGSLSIGIWDLFVIWCLKFVILSNFILPELVSHMFGNVETFSHLSLTAMG
jgi:hypothetical protein